MDKVNLDESLKAAFVELQEYLNLQVKYNKMLLAKKMGEVISHLALFVLLAGISGFLLIFLSFAFVVWFNQHFDAPYVGHLIVSGFYLSLALILVIFRKPLIYGPMRKLFGNAMFDEDEDRVGYEEAFRTTDNLNQRIRKFKKVIKKKEDKLGVSFGNLSEQFTFFNIMQTIGRNLYNSFVTTTNIARTTYSLFKRFSRRKQKVSKKKKGKRPEIEDNKS